MEFEAIIIAAYPFRDSDLILRVITKNQGKLGLLARRARSKKSGAKLDIFDHAQFLAKVGKGDLLTLHSHIPLSSFASLRDDLDKMTCASLVCECFDFLIEESDSHKSFSEYFELLKLTLEAIGESKELKEMLRSVFICLSRLLSMAGYLDTENELSPGTRSLLKLVCMTEEVGGRRLRSKDALRMSIKSLQDKEQAISLP